MFALKRILLCLIILLLTDCTPEKSGRVPSSTSLRGAWVQARSVLTKEGIDNMIRRAERGRFEQIFVGVFEKGRTIYPSRLTEQRDDVEPGLDPLAYIIEQAHQRDLQVHAWFEVGRVADNKGYSAVMEKHPDWGLVGPDGQTMPWLNFTRPEVREFVSDLMWEAVERGVDGLHFDYTRYPGGEWGFDDYSISTFNAAHDFDLNELRYADLPAYGHFEGNALLRPTTAQVLAKFSNGFPAVILNQFGDGQVLILNWQANQRKTAIGAEIINRGIESFLREGGRVYVLRSDTTIAKYEDRSFHSTVAWMESLGWGPVEVSAEEINLLDPESVLILPTVYLFSNAEASSLAQFVKAGGGAIFIDSPTPSMDLEEIRAVTGMHPERKYFKSWLLLTAEDTHSLLPLSDRTSEILVYEEHNEQWFTFRLAGVNALLEEVYVRIKEEHPDVLVTVTVTSDQRQAMQENLQDWEAWLSDGYIDMLIPRAYEDTLDELRSTLERWSYADTEHDQLAYGLIVFVESNEDVIQKGPEQLLREIRIAISSGSNGFMIFDLDRMDDGQLGVLADFEP